MIGCQVVGPCVNPFVFQIPPSTNKSYYKELSRCEVEHIDAYDTDVRVSETKQTWSHPGPAVP